MRRRAGGRGRPGGRPSSAHPRPPAGAPEAGAAEAPEWVLVGVVVGVFGLRGELKVRPETDFPERFARNVRVYVGPERAPMRVRGARLVPGQVILRLEEIGDADAAERLRGAALYVPTAEAAPLAPDQFYLHDVIGLRAERPDGTPLGTVADVYTGTGQDVFVVRPAHGGREVLVPAVKEMVKRVDVAGGVVVIDPIPGLFDEGFEVAEPTEPAE